MSDLETGAPVMFSTWACAKSPETDKPHNIGVAVLNIPQTLNSLTLECVDLLQAQLDAWSNDASIACIWIEGSGEKAFCAGGDVQALAASSLATPGGPCIEAETFFAHEYRMNHTLHRYKKPILVWGDGIVMGGGLGILAGGSHRVVTQTSRFAMPEVTIGLYPDVGGSYFLNRMPGSVGRFLSLTGASFNAADALSTGIANFYVDRERRNALVEALIQAAPDTHEKLTEALRSFGPDTDAAIPEGNVEAHSEVIEQLVGEAPVDIVMDNFNSLSTDDKWLQKAKQGISHGSPLSVLLIDRQLEACKRLSLAECFRRELILSTNIVRYPEFAEGVRALLIDKDKNPQWLYKAIAEVPGSLLDSFFESPWQVNPLADLTD